MKLSPITRDIRHDPDDNERWARMWRLELEDLLWAVATPAGDQDDYDRISHTLLAHYPDGEVVLEAAYALGGKPALRSMLTAALVAAAPPGTTAEALMGIEAATEPREDGRRLTAPDGSGDPNAPRYPLPMPGKPKALTSAAAWPPSTRTPKTP